MELIASYEYDEVDGQFIQVWPECGWQIRSSLAKLLAMAEQFGIADKTAIKSRLSYLDDEIFSLNMTLQKEQAHLAFLYLGPGVPLLGDSLEHALTIADTRDRLSTVRKRVRSFEAERNMLKEWLDIKSGKRKVDPDKLTEAQKEAARNYPIEEIIRGEDLAVQKNGMLKCPFHADSNESASIKRGVLYCFAGCRPGPEGNGKDYWDTIAFYRKYHDVGYIDAVRGILGLR